MHDELAVAQIGKIGDAGPIARREPVEQFGERRFAFAVYGHVDERIVAQEMLGAVGHLRAAEHDHHAGLALLQTARDGEREFLVPHIAGEAHHIGIEQMFDGRFHAQALIDRRQERIALRPS